MKTVKNKSGKRMINSHALVIAMISFILALIVGEIIVMVLMYFNRINGFAGNSELLITLYVIPAIAIVAMCVALYFNHRSLETSNTLIAALNNVAKGDYNAKIPYKRLDAFNAVYENFNKMTDELKSVKTLRDDFVRDFSHEFKTPIASINGFANLLLDGNLTEEEQTQIIKIIADESERLSHLSETVLLLARLETQQFVSESKTFRLDVQIKDCIVLMQKEWEGKNIEMCTELENVMYTGDENLIKQVWLNLLSNAIKFTPEGGKVTVRLKAEGGMAEVSVEDTGIGIPEESLPKIFDRYYQVKEGNGNGLGLAICSRICELCGGEITASSKLGEGSVFTVKL